MKIHLTFRENALMELTAVDPKDRAAILDDLARLVRHPEGPGLDIVRVQKAKHLLRLKVRSWRVFFTREQATIDVYAVRRRRGDDETYRNLNFDVSSLPLTTSRIQELDRVEGDPEDTRLLDPEPPRHDEHLPEPLDAARLTLWDIPDPYHPALTQCLTSDDLLTAPVPAEVIEAVLARLFPRSLNEIEQQARYTVTSVDMLASFLDGKLSDLLLHLDEEQAEVAARHLDRPTLIRGGPGTGKTVVALYRVLHLAEQEPGLHILYTTYTTTLAKYAQQLLTRLLEERGLDVRLDVRTVDSVLARYSPRGEQIDTADRAARDSLRETLRHFPNPLFERLGARYLLDEFHQIIDGWGLTRLDEYLTADRQGRQLPLTRSERISIWETYVHWRAGLERRRTVTWPQRRASALALVRPIYDAVIVDEAQDLSPVSLRCLLKLARRPQQFTLAADTNQSLYQRGLSWRAIDTALDMRGKTTVLRRTYRSTREIHAVLNDLARHEQLDMKDLPLEPQKSGPKPVRLTFENGTDYVRLTTFILEECRRLRIPLSGVAVLTPSTSAAEDAVTEFNALGTNAVYARGDDLELDYPAVKILTLHSAKGLEFPLVVLLDVNEGQIPRKLRDVPVEEHATYTSSDLKLLFVGCSRAMRQLVIAHDRDHPSSFLDIIDSQHWEHALI
ncbi:3'-5' exonuclease [Deinococcus aquaticus]|uniref:3'-5' exonuclease n=1 Tax=Deinococcus aquaticus TaxID=328692 RepID=UPI003F4568C9